MVSLNYEEELQDDDVVISGISGRFPMSDNIEEFQDNLLNKVDMVQPVKDPAWKNVKFEVPKYAGLIRNKDKFDAHYFGINYKTTNSLDIMTRLIMEKTSEAIFDAGLNPQMLQKSNTTIIIGAGLSESETTWLYSDTHTGLEFLGHSRALLANRVSFWLNVNAPSYAVSGMETSGIECINLAYNGIKKGHFDAALVGTIGLVFLPHMSYLYNYMGLLSQDGRTRSFDEGASGYARSDTVSVIFMQKAKDAKRVYAKITHIDAAYKHKNVDILRPCRDVLTEFLEEFYQTCGVDPTKIFFLEADGSATKQGDEEELNALDRVFLKKRKTPLLIGSVKSNMGHSCAGSNFSAIAKVLIAMQTGKIPPNLHYRNPPSTVPALKENRFKVVTETTPWTGGMVAVNTVSMSGVYGHMLLQTCGQKTSKQELSEDGLPRLVTFSARTQEGLQQVLQKLESMPVNVEFISLLHNIHSLPLRNHLYRGYTILPVDEKPLREIQYYNASTRPVWFVFSGMGSQWPGMGKEIMKLPVCDARIEKCHEILSQFGLDLKHIITTEDTTIFDDILHCFVGIAAIQLALVDALKVLNIVPDGIIGHSVGELGCAYADGCFTAEQMILAAYYRGLASTQAKLIRGSMAAVGLGYNQIKDMLPPEVDVACHNSDTSCTLSGPVERVTKFVAQLKEKGIFARVVNVANIAYHSRYIKPAAPALLEALKKVIPEPKTRSKLWVCTSLPEKDWDSTLAKYCSAEYHTNNLLSPVLFEESSRHIPKDAVLIEIAPHGLLQPILRRSLDPSCTIIPLTQRGHPRGLQFLLAAFGKIYLAGPVPKLQDIYPPVKFPVSRGTPSISPLVTWDYTENWHILDDLPGEKDTGEREVTISLNKAEDRIYADHIIERKIIMPSFAYLKLVWQAFAILLDKDHIEVPIVFENIDFHQQLEIPTRGSLKLYVMVQRGSGDFEISKNKKLVVSGRIREAESENENQDFHVSATGTELSSDDVYAEFQLRGCDYGQAFKGIQQVKLGNKGSSGKIVWSDNWVTFGESLLQLISLQLAEHNQKVIMPSAIRKITINPLKHEAKREVMEAKYSKELNMARCGSLELHQIEMAALDPALVQQQSIKMETIKFVPHCNPPVQGIKQFVEMCIQLVLENCRQTVSNLSIIELTTGHPLASLTPHLKAVLSHYSDVTLKSVAADNLHQITKEEKANCSLVVVTNSTVFSEAVSLLRNETGFVLMRTDVHEKCSDFITVAEHRCGTKKIVLLRKAYEADDEKSTVLYPVDDCSTWLSQVKECVLTERLYVVAHISDIGVGKLPNFVRQITADRQLAHVRCIFISDTNVSEFSLSKEPFKQIVKQDLVVNVLRGGTWGSFRSMLIANNAVNVPTRIQSRLPTLTKLKDITVQYLGIDPQDGSSSQRRIPENLHQQESLELVDFSGVTNDGVKVMGIAAACDKQSDGDTIQCLSWPLPDKWTLEDAATVPLAYTTAYHALIELANLEQHDTVLIHCGWTTVGQASIAIALHYDCTVFTSATTTEQRDFIKQKFPQIKEEHILSSHKESFEISLLRATNGKGVRVILNMSSVSAIDSTMNCLSGHSCVVHLGQDNLIRHSSMGMRVFLKNVSFWAVADDFLMSLSPESRKALHAAVQEGIVSGVVQPLVHQVLSKQQLDRAHQVLAEPNHIGRVVINMKEENKEAALLPVVKHHKFRCNSHGSYLVAGGNAEQCMDMAEWLVMHGAQQVVVALRSKLVSNLVRRRINILELYHKASIVLVSTPAATTASNAINLLQEARSASGEKLMGIFILPAETSGQENSLTALTVAQLDVASRSIKSLQHFVCLMSEGSWSTCEARHQQGLMALAVYWPEAHIQGFSLRKSLTCLDKLLLLPNQEPIVIITHSKLAASSKGYQLSSLGIYLPSSLTQLQAFGGDLCGKSVCIERLQSQIPDTVITEDTPKVFLIPGLQGAPREVLCPLAMRLIYPVFCLKMGTQDNKSLVAVAQDTVECIQRIQKSGSYYLVGVSWGGGLTLEVAKLLEAQGHQTRIVLVDGALETSRLILASLESSNSAKMQANLLCELLQISHQKLLLELTNLPTWETRVERAMSELPAECLSNREDIVRALNIILSRVSVLLSYQPKDILLSGAVTLVRPVSGDKDENCGLMQYFKQTVVTQVVEGDHRTILTNPLTARTINSFAI